ncbi:hypothetical protein [Streptomyces sp. KL116D]|uniref:hypothetical protein n=1 Tax=Streptomyces sp. KL116D TaxID=3045152 RepID=UPI003555D1BC
MIAVVCFEFTFGVLGDLFGRRRLVLAGTALIAAGSTRRRARADRSGALARRRPERTGRR